MGKTFFLRSTVHFQVHFDLHAPEVCVGMTLCKKGGWVRRTVSLAPHPVQQSLCTVPLAKQLTRPLGGNHFHISWTLSHLSMGTLLICLTNIFEHLIF